MRMTQTVTTGTALLAALPGGNVEYFTTPCASIVGPEKFLRRPLPALHPGNTT
jgi:hypothetical protein